MKEGLITIRASESGSLNAWQTSLEKGGCFLTTYNWPELLSEALPSLKSEYDAYRLSRFQSYLRLPCQLQTCYISSPTAL